MKCTGIRYKIDINWIFRVCRPTMYNFWNIWISSSTESCSLSPQNPSDPVYQTHATNFTVKQAVLQFPTLSERDGSASLGTWDVRTLNRISIGSLERRSDRPVIGGDLVDALVPAGWGRLILVHSQSTSGYTQPGERPVTSRSWNVLSTRQHSIMGYATDEESHSGPQRLRFGPPKNVASNDAPV